MCKVEGCTYPAGHCKWFKDVESGDIALNISPPTKRVKKKVGSLPITATTFKISNPYVNCELRSFQTFDQISPPK